MPGNSLYSEGTEQDLYDFDSLVQGAAMDSAGAFCVDIVREVREKAKQTKRTPHSEQRKPESGKRTLVLCLNLTHRQ